MNPVNLLFSAKWFGESNYWIIFTGEWWGTTVKWHGVPTDLYVVVLILSFLTEELIHGGLSRCCVMKHSERVRTSTNVNVLFTRHCGGVSQRKEQELWS